MILLISVGLRRIALEIQTKSRKLSFDWNVSFGNILTIVIFLITGLIAYIRLEDQVANMQSILGFDLTTAYKAGLELDSKNPAVVANQINPKNRVANVDALPEIKK